MGSANCCKKPDEIVIEEIAGNNDNEYPEDTQQNHRSNPNEQEENVKVSATSNQNLYEQDIVSQKLVVLTKFLLMYPALSSIIYKGKEKKHMSKMI